MNPAALGLIIGTLLGIVAAVGDFGDFAIAVLLAAIGFVVGKVVQGDIDVSSYVSSAEQKVKDKL